MTISRLRGHSTGIPPSFGRAKISRPTLLLLVFLRFYAIAAISIAVYSFFVALR